MTRLLSPFSIISLMMATLIWWPSLALGQENGAIECRVSSGLDGIWKVGFPTRHAIEIRSSQPLSGVVSIHTVDGDGVPVVYRDPSWSFDIQGTRSSVSLEIIARHGRGNRPIKIRLADRDQKTLLERAITEDERGLAIPSDQPWIVGIGNELRLRQVAMKSIGSAWGDFSVSVDQQKRSSKPWR